MKVGKCSDLIFFTIALIVLSCAFIYCFKEARKWTKEDKLLLELYDLLECLLTSV